MDEQAENNSGRHLGFGDVNGGPQFTHISYNDFQIVYANLYEGKRLSTADRLVPYAVYTDPAWARRGYGEGARGLRATN